MERKMIMVIVCLVFFGNLAAKAVPPVHRGEIAIPLAFTENRGQVCQEVLFYAKTPGCNVGVTKRGLIFSDGSQLRLLGVNNSTIIVPVGPPVSKAHFFVGNDPKRWRTGVDSYAAVLYRDIYDGIDLKIYGNERHIEYDWIVTPNADPRKIRFTYRNVREALLDTEGNLRIDTVTNRAQHKRPVAYQIINGRKVTVSSSFRALKGGVFGFEVGAYDPAVDLVIDPLMFRFATYLGGTDSSDSFGCIIVDEKGFIYICGETFSSDFPVASAIQPKLSLKRDGFIAKIDPENSQLLFSTFLGGSGHDTCSDLALGPGGSLYVTGTSNSLDFPLKDPFQANRKGPTDVIVVKLSASGDRLLYSTYLGGSEGDSGEAIEIDAGGAIFLTGRAEKEFPLVNPIMTYSGSSDMFVARMAPGGQKLMYSTYIGGGSQELGLDMCLDEDGAVFVGGYTMSPDFPIVNGWQTLLGGMGDVVCVKLSPDGRTILFSSFLGGSDDDKISSVKKGADGYYYMEGWTFSQNFPVKNAFQKESGGDFDVFLACGDIGESKLVFSTYFGGSALDRGGDVELGSDGRIYLTGNTHSTDFHLQNPMQSVIKGEGDFFISVFNHDASVLEFSTYLGGRLSELGGGGMAELDKDGNLYLFGRTWSSNMVIANPIQGNNHGGGDLYLAKMRLADEPSVEIVAPESHTTVSGMVGIELEPKDEANVRKIDLYIDDKLVFTYTDMDSPLRYDLDTSTIKNGLHLIFVSLLDKDGYYAYEEAWINVQNAEIVLNVKRVDDRGWLVRKACAQLVFSVQKPSGLLPITAYDIYRQPVNGEFRKIASVPDSEPGLLKQYYTFIDPGLPSGQTCSYRILAVSETGEVLGASEICTL